jgi:HEPN domain-containing protein
VSRPKTEELLARGTPLETLEEQHRRLQTDQVQSAARAVDDWWSKNKKACDFHSLAVEDYILARAGGLHFGLLHSSLATAAQAVEKYLKAYLIALGQPHKYKHDIPKLLAAVERNCPTLDLTSYREFAGSLKRWYEWKYPDAQEAQKSWYRDAVHQLDSLVYLLEENFPMSPEVSHLKYGGGNLGIQWTSIFVRMFASSYAQHRHALLLGNNILEPKASALWARFADARMLAPMPATTREEEEAHRARFA